MAGPWLDALLGAIFNQGVSLPLSGGLNFLSPLSAVRNPSTGIIDVGTADESVTVETLAPIDSDNTAPMFAIHVAIPAATPGTADDQPIRLNMPFAFTILDSLCDVTVGIAASTAQLRTATGGGGSSLSSAFDTGTSTVTSRNSLGGTTSVSVGGNIYLRRSNRGVACKVVILGIRA